MFYRIADFCVELKLRLRLFVYWVLTSLQVPLFCFCKYQEYHSLRRCYRLTTNGLCALHERARVCRSRMIDSYLRMYYLSGGRQLRVFIGDAAAVSDFEFDGSVLSELHAPYLVFTSVAIMGKTRERDSRNEFILRVIWRFNSFITGLVYPVRACCVNVFHRRCNKLFVAYYPGWRFCPQHARLYRLEYVQYHFTLHLKKLILDGALLAIAESEQRRSFQRKYDLPAEEGHDYFRGNILRTRFFCRLRIDDNNYIQEV